MEHFFFHSSASLALNHQMNVLKAQFYCPLRCGFQKKKNTEQRSREQRPEYKRLGVPINAQQGN
jgi:hypothetical protein